MDSILVVTATEIEMSYVADFRSNFVQGEVKRRGGFLYLVTGIGIINSAIFLTKAILENKKVKGVINLGIAGSFNEERFPVGEVVLVEEEIWGEFGIKENKILSCKKLGFPLGILGKEKIWNRLVLEPEKSINKLGLEANFEKRAKSLTVSTVTGDQENEKLLKENFAPDIENMEGFSLAWVCKLMDLPFLEIRVVSNLVGEKRKESWNLKGALKKLKEVSKSILE